MPPRADGVEPDDEQLIGSVHGLGRFPFALELPPRVREATGGKERDVVVPGHRENLRAETAEERRRAGVLVPPPAVGDVTRGDDQLRPDALYERAKRRFDIELLVDAGMEV